MHVIVVTGRMFQSVRPCSSRPGSSDPVICYQGAVVADADGHAGCGTCRSRSSSRARRSRPSQAEGYAPNVYVDDELYVARAHPRREAYAAFQHLEIHAVGDLLDWLDAPPTKLVCVGDPAALDELAPRLRAQFGERHVHHEVAARTSSSSRPRA